MSWSNNDSESALQESEDTAPIASYRRFDGIGGGSPGGGRAGEAYLASDSYDESDAELEHAS